MKEYWRELKYKDIKPIFLISNKGRVMNKETGKIRKINYNSKNGYAQVTLVRESGKKRSFSIHKLVALHFLLFKKVDKLTINHKDGDKKNNSVTNLEWANHKEQNLHAYRMNLRASGEKHHFAKHSEELIHSICMLLEEGNNATEIIAYLNLPNDRNMKNTINRIKRRERWHLISEQYNF